MASLSLILAVIIGLGLAARTPDLARLVAVPALLLCVHAGLTLPDIDQPLPLDHRSAVTHSILPALLCLLRRWARPVAAGVALGLGLHLAADVFPNAMIGFATVKLPFGGSIGSDWSYAWLAVNALGCSILGGILLHDTSIHPNWRVVAIAGTALIGLWYLLRVDGGWPALALYLLAGWLALRRVKRRS